jgi:hypothetical protein
MLIVEDGEFHCLMKTGRPTYRIPTAKTVAKDVHVVFHRVKEHVGKMLQVSLLFLICLIVTHLVAQAYDGRLSFATDAWTSPNSQAFIALTVHYEVQGTPTCLLLDDIELAKSHSGHNLAVAFAQVLENLGSRTR